LKNWYITTLIILLTSCSQDAAIPFDAALKVLFNLRDCDSNNENSEYPWNIECPTENAFDTIEINVPYSYAQAIEALKVSFIDIDKRNPLDHSSTLSKLYLIADLIYGSFNFVLWGPKLGSAETNMLNWEKLSYAERFNLANANKCAPYCAERTEFFLHLADSLLGVSGAEASISGRHSYPIVFIKNDRGDNLFFVVDPYDPFIVCDKSNGTLLDIATIIEDKNSQFNLYRTKRHFGKSELLISHALKQWCESQTENQGYCAVIKQAQFILKNVGDNTANLRHNNPNYTDVSILVNNPVFDYAVAFDGRQHQLLCTKEDFIWNYLGNGIELRGNTEQREFQQLQVLLENHGLLLKHKTQSNPM
jgi:hypothetical protein